MSRKLDMLGEEHSIRLSTVLEAIRDAWDVVEASEIPEALHAVAFEQAVRLIVGGRQTGACIGHHLGVEASLPDRGEPVGKAKGIGSSAGGALRSFEDAEFFSRFAAESGVAEDRLRQVYFLKDGQPRIGVTKSKLGSTEAERNRTLSTLLAGERWYIEGVPTVSIGEVRDAAANVPYEVSRNLSKHLGGIAGTMSVGAKGDRAIRVQSGKFDEPFSALIEKLTSS